MPSADDAVDEVDAPATPKAQASSLPSTLPSSPSHGDSSEELSRRLTGDASIRSESTTSLTPTFPKANDPIHLLSSLRHTFQRTEQALYAQLTSTPISSLNDVRRSFHSAARGASKRLLAWQKKHISGTVKAKLTNETLSAEEPEWWRKGCHAVPGGNIVVREDDWGSIISFTLR